MSRVFVSCFFGFAFAALANRLLALWPNAYLYTDATVMPWLLAFTIGGTQGMKNIIRVLLALGIISCIAGGLFIRLVPPQSDTFGWPVGCYMLASLLFSVAFILEVHQYGRPLFVRPLWWFGPMALAVLWLSMQLLWPGTGRARYIILTQGVCVAIMSLCAVARWHAVSDASFFSVIIGVVLFVFSNLFFAVSRFVFDLPYGDELNISTYFASIFLIVMGVVQQHQLHKQNP